MDECLCSCLYCTLSTVSPPFVHEDFELRDAEQNSSYEAHRECCPFCHNVFFCTCCLLQLCRPCPSWLNCDLDFRVSGGLRGFSYCNCCGKECFRDYDEP